MFTTNATFIIWLDKIKSYYKIRHKLISINKVLLNLCNYRGERFGTARE